MANITDLDEFRRRSQDKPEVFTVSDQGDDVVITSPGPITLLNSIQARALGQELIDIADMIEGLT